MSTSAPSPVHQLASLKLSHNADSVAVQSAAHFDTTTGITTQTAVIGTYTLTDATSTTTASRIGGLHPVVISRKFHSDNPTFSLSTQSSLSTPGVFDVIADPPHPSSSSDSPTLFAACADNALLCVPPDHTTPLSITPPDCQSSTLTLSVHVTRDRLVSGDSNGLVVVRDRDAAFTSTMSRVVHMAETWSVCTLHDGTILSGGDDGILAATDIRTSTPVWRVRDAHGTVGVTCVTQNTRGMLWTGGYDDMVRVWDVRAMNKPICQTAVGGGVWRIRFHPSRPGLVLIAAMYDGCKILRETSDNVDMLAQFREHESIAYGAEWMPALEQTHGLDAIALTASFYDRAIFLWSVQDTSVSSMR